MATRDALVDRIRELLGEGLSWEDAAVRARDELGCPAPDIPDPPPRFPPRRPHRTRRRRWTARDAARVVCQAALHESIGDEEGGCQPRDGAAIVRAAIDADDCARRVLADEEPVEDIQRILDALSDARDAVTVILVLLDLILALLELVVGKIPARVVRYLRELIRVLRRRLGG